MHFLVLLEQPWPVLLLHVLFPEHKLDIAGAVYRLGVLDVKLGVKVQLDVIGGFLGFGFAGEGETRGLDVNFAGLGRDVRSGDGEIDDVFLGR